MLESFTHKSIDSYCPTYIEYSIVLMKLDKKNSISKWHNLKNHHIYLYSSNSTSIPATQNIF